MAPIKHLALLLAIAVLGTLTAPLVCFSGVESVCPGRNKFPKPASEHCRIDRFSGQAGEVCHLLERRGRGGGGRGTRGAGTSAEDQRMMGKALHWFSRELGGLGSFGDLFGWLRKRSETITSSRIFPRQLCNWYEPCQPPSRKATPLDVRHVQPANETLIEKRGEAMSPLKGHMENRTTTSSRVHPRQLCNWYEPCQPPSRKAAPLDVRHIQPANATIVEKLLKGHLKNQTHASHRVHPRQLCNWYEPCQPPSRKAIPLDARHVQPANETLNEKRGHPIEKREQNDSSLTTGPPPKEYPLPKDAGFRLFPPVAQPDPTPWKLSHFACTTLSCQFPACKNIEACRNRVPADSGPNNYGIWYHRQLKNTPCGRMCNDFECVDFAPCPSPYDVLHPSMDLAT